MRIGIDADPVGRDRSGNEVYLRGIVGGLQRVAGTGDELVLFGSVPDALRELAAGTTQVAGVRAGLLGELALGRAMTRAGVDFTWHEFNAAHAFMRDEGPRYDPAAARICYGLTLELFHRRLGAL